MMEFQLLTDTFKSVLKWPKEIQNHVVDSYLKCQIQIVQVNVLLVNTRKFLILPWAADELWLTNMWFA